jgi:predicted RNA-binding protein with PUA-like domain
LTQYANDWSINSNIFFCSEDNVEGLVGLAWIGVVCYPDPQYRVALVEYYDSDATTGWVSVAMFNHVDNSKVNSKINIIICL